MAEILAITHPGDDTVGVFAAAAAQLSLTIEQWSVAGGGEPQRPINEYRGLVVLGGDQNIDEVERYPFLEREFSVVDDWIAGGRPLLGVCLGAQMIAHVTGGSVFKASEREFGWLEIEQLEAGRSDPVTGFAKPQLTGLLWHEYAFEPPAPATILARNRVCVQAFRLGEAWGVQHHPEVDEEVLNTWLEPLLAGISGAKKRRQAELVAAGCDDYLAAWNDYGRDLFRRFSERCC